MLKICLAGEGALLATRLVVSVPAAAPGAIRRRPILTRASPSRSEGLREQFVRVRKESLCCISPLFSRGHTPWRARVTRSHLSHSHALALRRSVVTVSPTCRRKFG